jgi:DoxX
MDAELLLLRGVVGPLMVGHGAGKLFGASNAGSGIEGTAGFLDSFGFRPGKPWAYLHGAAELGSGAGMTAGVLTRLPSGTLIRGHGHGHTHRPRRQGPLGQQRRLGAPGDLWRRRRSPSGAHAHPSHLPRSQRRRTEPEPGHLAPAWASRSSVGCRAARRK